MRKTHGSGLEYQYLKDQRYPKTIIEDSVRIFYHPLVKIGEEAYIGHNTILYGYNLKGFSIDIGPGAWIGAKCFIHGAGGISIRSTLKDPVGIGPGVTMLTSQHDPDGNFEAVMGNPLIFEGIDIGAGADIGACAVICPGVTIGRGAIVGAGAIVVKDVAPFSIVAGNPAKLIRMRKIKTPEVQ
jgi:acetyltransferase-like isoleucine patch superfamily enzyme